MAVKNIKYDVPVPKGYTARIADLRERGYTIKTEMVTKKNDDGHTVNFAKYRMEV